MATEKVKGLEFNRRCGNYGVRACPKQLVRTKKDEENGTIQLVKYYEVRGQEFCFTLAWFKYDPHKPDWDLHMIGSRLADIPSIDIQPVWAALRLAYQTLREWSDLDGKK